MSETRSLRELVTPQVPLLGSVDQALLASRQDGGLELQVEGWLAHPDFRALTLEVYLEGAPGVLARRVDRLDIVRQFGDVTHEHIFGFEATLAVPPVLSNSDHCVLAFLLTDHNGEQAGCSFPITPIRANASAAGQAVADERGGLRGAFDAIDVEHRLLAQLEQSITLPSHADPLLSIIVFGTERSLPLLHELARQAPEQSETLFVYCPASGGDYSFLRHVHGLRPLPVPPKAVWAQRCNAAWHAARGRYLLLIDGELRLLPGVCNAAVAELDSRGEASTVGGLIVSTEGLVLAAGGVMYRTADFGCWGEGSSAAEASRFEARRVDYSPSSLLAVRREALESCDGFEELLEGRRFADADVQLRFSYAGWENWFSPRLAAEGAAIQTGGSGLVEEGPADRGAFSRAHQALLERRAVAGDQRREAAVCHQAAARIALLAGPRSCPAEETRIEHLAAGLTMLGIDVTVILYGPCAESAFAAGTRIPDTVSLLRLPSIERLGVELLAALEQDGWIWCLGLSQVRLVHALVPPLFGRPVRVIADEGVRAEGLDAARPDWHGDGADLEPGGRIVQPIVVDREHGTVRSLREWEESARSVTMLVVRSREEQQWWHDHGVARVTKLTLDDLLQRRWGELAGLLLRPQADPSSAADAEPRRNPYGFGESRRLRAGAENADRDLAALLGSAHAESSDGRRSTDRTGYFQAVVEHDLVIDIIVPVFNAFSHLKRCLESVVEHTDRPYRLIVIDDASVDDRVWPWLSAFRRSASSAMLRECVIRRNNRNVGFPETVNRGFALSAGHVVILNSDTEVVPGWLGRMLAPMLRDDRIASVTPLSNSATICSFPIQNGDQPPRDGASASAIDECVYAYGSDTPFEIPTGVGFCMMLSRAALDAVGWFDASLFGHGYGEENDWCRRAAARGFRNVAIANLHILHAEGASFATARTVSKKKRIERNLQMLALLHPEYDATVAEHIAADPMREVRQRIQRQTTARHAALPGVLYIHPNRISGGSELFLKAAMESRAASERQFLLSGDTVTVTFSDSGSQTPWRRAADSWSFSWSDFTSRSFRALLDAHAISEIVVNHVIGLRLAPLIEALAECGRPYSFFVHDYFTACPSYTLLRGDGTSCGGETRTDVCERCLRSGIKIQEVLEEPLEDVFIRKWRGLFESFLRGAHSVIAPSDAARQILARYYPDAPLVTHRHRPRQHLERTFEPSFALRSPLTVAVIGAINRSKGERVIEQLGAMLRDSSLPLRCVVLGYTSRSQEPFESSDGRFIVHGSYESKELGGLLAKYETGVVVLPSIWAETFSYTTQEALDCGFPVAAFDHGGQAEQIRTRRGGWLVAVDDVEGLRDCLLRLCSDRSEIQRVAAGIVPQHEIPLLAGPLSAGDSPRPFGNTMPESSLPGGAL